MLLVISEIPVSVVVPVFNAQEYISECIDSILAQTLKPLELILVDDGSTDTSGNICDEYSRKNPLISVIHTANKGAAAARLEGAHAAKGRYVGFVDSDDVVSPYMYETLYLAAVYHNLDCAKIETGDLASACFPSAAASANCFTVYTGNRLKDRYIQTYVAGKNETVSMCDKIVKREILLSGNGEEKVKNVLEDFAINMNMALKYSRYGELPCAFYFVRYRKGSLSRCYHPHDYSVLIQVWKQKCAIMQHLQCSRDDWVSAHIWFVSYSLSLIHKLFRYKHKTPKIQEALKILKATQLAESCRFICVNNHTKCRILYRMIGNRQCRLSLITIIIRYMLGRVYEVFRYWR